MKRIGKLIEMARLGNGAVTGINDENDNAMEDCEFAGMNATQLQDALANENMNLLYVRHYPKDMKYLALFPNSDEKLESNMTIQELIRQSIERAKESGRINKKDFCLHKVDVMGTGGEDHEEKGLPSKVVVSEDEKEDEFFA